MTTLVGREVERTRVTTHAALNVRICALAGGAFASLAHAIVKELHFRRSSSCMRMMPQELGTRSN
jgi:hypothetical protein